MPSDVSPPPPKKWEKYFSGNYHVKFKFGHFSGKYLVKFGNFVIFSDKYNKNFWHFVNFSYIIFRQKRLASPKAD